MTKPDFQMSSDARLILAHIRKKSVGEVATYDELSNVISSTVNGATGSLRTAMRRMLKDDDIVFAVVRGVGIKRLNDGEIVDESQSYSNAIRRKAKNSFERVSKVDFQKLTTQQQARASAQMSIMATLAHMTKQSTVSKIEARMPTGKQELPINDTLKLFVKD